MKICQFVLKLLSGNEILGNIKDNYSGTNVRKMTCDNPNEDLVNMNAYVKFGEILSISSQDFERNRNFGAHQGPSLWYKCAKKVV